MMFKSCLSLYFLIICLGVCLNFHLESPNLKGNQFSFLGTDAAEESPVLDETSDDDSIRSWNRRSLQKLYNDLVPETSDSTDPKHDDTTLKEHLATMGHPNTNCDDGKTNLDIDWNGDPLMYTCYDPKRPLPVDKEIQPLLECEKIPAGYWPKHVCMDTDIEYDSDLPTHEDHRPLWAVFGEYMYVPPQRWLHNVEHGSVIMLYHPCAEPSLVNELKTIVKNCIRKHVITANALLPSKMPLALVAWGCRLRMNYVDASTVIDFIKKHGKTGPERFLSKEGQYNLTLLEKADIPLGSDYADSRLCPMYS